MNIFKILANLYTNRKSDWIKSIDETQVQPYLIQRWLVMNDSLRVQTRWLDKYVFVLTPKMYLSLAWSIIPKLPKTPFVKYIKQQVEEEEFAFILDKIRQHFDLSDNDFNANKERLLKAIKEDMPSWFSYYGVPKRMWNKYKLDFNLIKKFGVKEDMSQKGLESWGM